MNPGAGAQAGRRGADVRSDLFVNLERNDGGELVLDIRSKVAAFYGKSLRADLERTFGQLALGGATVQVEDSGALPFVVCARAEAAARRAGAGEGRDARPVRTAPRHARSHPRRLRRSRLYLPGNEPKFMVNAGLHRPDGVILDLEDSVHPAEKDAARILVRNALRCVDFGEAERMVRINQGELGLTDLEAVVPESPDLILLPKAESPEQIAAIGERIEVLAAQNGVEEAPWLMPILESALGIENAHSIARAHGLVVALTLGLEDYTADLGVQKTFEGEESAYARQRVVNAARAAGLQAIDSVYGDVGDVEGLRRWATRSKAMGFTGMGCIHPRQIHVIHGAFAPAPEELEKALRIVKAFEEAQARGLAVVNLGNRMIDPPVVQRARDLVERARQWGLLPSTGRDGGAA